MGLWISLLWSSQKSSNTQKSQCLKKKPKKVWFAPIRKIQMPCIKIWTHFFSHSIRQAISLEQHFKFTSGSFSYALNLKPLGGTGNYYCASTKYDDLTIKTCQSQSYYQHWVLNPVRSNAQHFLIKHYETRKFLVPKARRNGSDFRDQPHVILIKRSKFETYASIEWYNFILYRYLLTVLQNQKILVLTQFHYSSKLSYSLTMT